MSEDRLLDFVRATNRVADAADGMSATFARQLEAVLRDTERLLRPLLADLAEGNPVAIVTAARAARVRLEIRDVLKSAGYDALADEATGQPLDQIVKDLLSARAIAQTIVRFPASVAQRVEALKALQLADLLDEGDATARAVWQATVRGVFSSQPTDVILADLGDVLDRAAPHIRRLYDTSISIFGRQVEALQAGDDPKATFAYMGPADEKTRPFCMTHVGKVYTRAAIDQMDNGQLPNVFLTGGGYNCRHMWMAVSRFSELQDLVGTGERIPEVARQVAQHGKAA